MKEASEEKNSFLLILFVAFAPAVSAQSQSSQKQEVTVIGGKTMANFLFMKFLILLTALIWITTSRLSRGILLGST